MADPLATLLVIELRPEPGAAGIARQFATTACEASGIDPETCTTAALLVSELVTNAIVHARTRVRLELHPASSRLRVDVTDEDHESQVRLQRCNPTAPHGRGLQLVDALALDWGVSRTESTKTVWFELDAAAADTGRPSRPPNGAKVEDQPDRSDSR